MSSWKHEAATLLRRGAHDVERAFDAGKRRVSRALRWDECDPYTVLPYNGFGNGQRAWLSGRVLRDPLPGGPKEDDGWWDNLLAMWQRWESDEVPSARLTCEFAGRTWEATTDDEGYFAFEFDLADAALPDQFWHTAQVRLTELRQCNGSAVRSEAGIMIPPDSATFGVISDLDDTVIQTGATDLWRAAKLTFLKNARTRLPFEGVAAFYTALHHGRAGAAGEGGPQRNPMFYVSSSAWNLYDFLADFLDLQGLPAGPVLLRDLGIDDAKFIKSGHGHKHEKIDRILAAFPSLPFVLVGDSGQEDAEIYAAAVRHHGPERFKAIYIRDVSETAARDAEIQRIAQGVRSLGVEMLRVQDSAKAAEHAAGLGLLEESALATIRRDKAEDAGTEAGKDA